MFPFKDWRKRGIVSGRACSCWRTALTGLLLTAIGTVTGVDRLDAQQVSAGLESTDPEASRRAAWSYLEAHHEAKALVAAQIAAGLFPGDPETRAILAKALL